MWRPATIAGQAATTTPPILLTSPGPAMTDDTTASVDTDNLFPDAEASRAGAARQSESDQGDRSTDTPTSAGGDADGARDSTRDTDADPGAAAPADASDAAGASDATSTGPPATGAGPDEAQGNDPDREVEGDEPIDWEARADEDGRSRAELLEALTSAEVERNDWLDQLRRKQAEFDNFRKRMARDAQRQRVVGQEAVARSLLDVLDDFERTVAALEADEAARKGVELVRDKLLVALEGQGMVPMEAAGQAFDPNLHEAVQQVPGDDGNPTVAEVLRTGWMMHDRVLRPAMVVVAQ